MSYIRYVWWKKYYQYRLLIFGISLIVCSAYFFLPTIWTFKSDLTLLTGTLRSANTYVTTVSNTDRNGYTSKSQKSELIFYLNQRKQKYYLAENIGDKFRDDKYETILQGLRRADTVTVWIKKNSVDEYQPQIFQIDNDKGTLLDFETVRMNYSPVALLTFSLGVISIAAFLWIKNPDKFKKLIGLNELTN